MASVPTWLGGSSWRGGFGDIGVSMNASSIAARAAAARAGRRRSLHDPISLLIVVVAPQELIY